MSAGRTGCSTILVTCLLVTLGCALKVAEHRQLGDEVLPPDVLTLPADVPAGVRSLKIDVGCGFHPLPAESDTFLVMIEPQQKAADMLKLKFKDNKNVHVIHAAISNFTGAANLSHYMVEGRMSSIDVPYGTWHRGTNAENFELVSVTTLARVIEHLPLGHFGGIIDFLQVDAQGEDFKIVKSAGELIKKVKEMTVEANEDGFRTYMSENSRQLNWQPLMKGMGFKEDICKPGFKKNSYGFHAAELHCTYKRAK